MAGASLPAVANGTATRCRLGCERERGGKERREEEERTARLFKLSESRQPTWRDSVMPFVLVRLVVTRRTSYDPSVASQQPARSSRAKRTGITQTDVTLRQHQITHMSHESHVSVHGVTTL
jgi:hypothetical protein